ncbi:MAG TPA: PfkB family carbohydrate kinase [Actinotalea sp.]|nr:PfkB family carbohydrate kinase [Actinotalea sp.]
MGSGDAFLAGLVSGLDRGADLAAAMWTATGAAVANAQQPGARILDPALAAEVARAGRDWLRPAL